LKVANISTNFFKIFNQGKYVKKGLDVSDPRLYTEGVENTFTHEGLS